MIDVTCVGEVLIDLVATESGVGVGDALAFQKAAGGAPANVAVGVARLGRRSAFLGAVADDQFGAFLVRTLSDQGIDVTFVCRVPGASTSLAFVAIGPGGERDFLFYRNGAADTRLRVTDVSAELIARTRILHFGTFSLAVEPARGATLRAAEEGRRVGALVSLDVNFRPAVWPDLATMREAAWRAIELADLVKLNEDELQLLTGDSDEAGLREVGERGPRVVVLTRGGQGCLALFGGDVIGRGGFAVDPVDTTGAGDGFVAGLLVGLLERASGPVPLDGIDRAQFGNVLDLANAAGALTTTRRGAIPALPTRSEVQALMREACQSDDLAR